MKRISILCAVLVMFVLGSSAALAKGPKEGKGKPDTARAQAEKGKGKVAREAEASEEKVKAEKEKAEKKAKAAKEKAEDDVEEAEKKAEKVKKEKAEKAKEQSEEADDDDKAAGKGKGKSAAAKGKGKGQQGAARAKQIEHEAQKHETRKARLEEMLKVAEGKGDEKAVGRIQKLIDREQGRFEKKNKKMTERGSKEAGDEVDEDGADENEDDE